MWSRQPRPQTIIVSFSGGVVSASSTSDYYCVFWWRCGLGSLTSDYYCVIEWRCGLGSLTSDYYCVIEWRCGLGSLTSDYYCHLVEVWSRQPRPQTIIVSFSGGVVSASSTSDYYCVIEWRCGLGSLDLRLLLSFSGGVVSASSTSDYYCHLVEVWSRQPHLRPLLCHLVEVWSRHPRPQTIVIWWRCGLGILDFRSLNGGVVSASSTSDYYCVVEWRCGLGSLANESRAEGS